MAVKVPVMYKDMYLGNMEETQAEYIMQIRNTPVIPNLKHMIFNFPKDMVAQSIEEGLSIRQIIKRDNIDYSQFVGELRDYQTVGTAFMYMSPRSVIADGVGLGKTAEISALINYLKQQGDLKRFIMAVETSALAQTTYELMRFTGLRVVAMPGEAAKINRMIKKTDWTNVDGIVIKHSTLKSDALSKWIAMNMMPDGTNRVFDTFLLDESSVIKNDNTKTFRYTQNLCNLAKRCHFMNATVFETNIMDIYYQFDMMDPSLMPKKWRIEQDFCTHKKSFYWTRDKQGKAVQNWKFDRSGYKNQAIFKERLKLVYFGRCKADIGMDKPHIHKVYEIDPSTEQMLAIQKGYRYSEVLNCPSLVEDINIPTNRENVPKLERLCSLIENEFSDEQVMVYCFHLDAQKAIAEEMRKIGRKPVILNGACNDDERFDAQEGFNSGKYDIIITNIKKSLNLHGGDVCIFYSLETNIAKMEQIHGRIDRNTDDRIKTFIMLLYRNTDEYRFFTDVVGTRAKDSRDLTIDAKTAADYFMEALKELESAELNN